MAKEKTRKMQPGLYAVGEEVNGEFVQSLDIHGNKKWMLKATDNCGRQITRRFRGTATKAREALRVLQNEARSDLDSTKRNKTLEQFIPEWVDNCKRENRANAETIKRNEADMKRIVALVGGMKMRTIDDKVVNKTLATIQEEKGLSAATMNKLFSTWRAVMAYAVRVRVIPFNPFDALRAPKPGETDREPLSAEECVVLSDYIDKAEEDALAALEAKEERVDKLSGKDYYHDGRDTRGYVRGITRFGDVVAVRMLFELGIRKGEALALTWDCVDLGGEPYVWIKHSLMRDRTVKSTKTKSGKRKIYISAGLAWHLKRWRRVQKEHLQNVAGIRFSSSLPVFSNARGEYQYPRNFQRFWSEFRKDAGMPMLRMHELRHTWATRMAETDVPMRELMYLGGWSDVRVPYQIYADANPERYKASATVMANAVKDARDEAKKVEFLAVKTA